jgi:hypothetical protein
VADLNERDLNAELLRIYEECGKFGYWPKRFYQMIAPHCERYVGGVAAVRKLLEAGGSASGLIRLLDEDRLDLSIENLVLSPKWSHLFKPWDIKKAQENLRYAKALHRAKAKPES